MKREYIPILVERNFKQELWRIDVTDMSVTQLIELKEKLLSIPYDKTIQILDAMINRNIKKTIPSHHMNSGSYMRQYKKNKKEENHKRKVKNIRRKYDKHKR